MFVLLVGTSSPMVGAHQMFWFQVLYFHLWILFCIIFAIYVSVIVVRKLLYVFYSLYLSWSVIELSSWCSSFIIFYVDVASSVFVLLRNVRLLFSSYYLLIYFCRCPNETTACNICKTSIGIFVRYSNSLHYWQLYHLFFIVRQ